jgi:ribosomal protein L11 methyltransferase
VNSVLEPEQPLYVYELKGGVPPPFLNLEGLMGVWPEAEYTYLFFTAPANAVLEPFFQEHPEFSLTRQYQMPYGHWQQLAVQEPLTVDRFKVITRPQRIHLAQEEILLWIDSGIIFGSGLHPTTRGCLRALSVVFSDTTPSTVLDLGTGSGILAIAAAKLGAERVEAVDLNPMAISTAAENCRRNEVENAVRLRRADAREFLPDAELLCVNIHFDFLHSLLRNPDLYRYQWVIIGGFLKDKLPVVRELLPSRVLVKEPEIEEKSWITLILEIGSSQQ